MNPINAHRLYIKWKTENPESYRLCQANKNRQRLEYKKFLRGTLLTKLGGKCVRCGFSDARILQVDHVNGNGHREKIRRRSAILYYRDILIEVEQGSKEYQCLCPNCNWIKRIENGEEN